MAILFTLGSGLIRGGRSKKLMFNFNSNPLSLKEPVRTLMTENLIPEKLEGRGMSYNVPVRGCGISLFAVSRTRASRDSWSYVSEASWGLRKMMMKETTAHVTFQHFWRSIDVTFEAFCCL